MWMVLAAGSRLGGKKASDFHGVPKNGLKLAIRVQGGHICGVVWNIFVVWNLYWLMETPKAVVVAKAGKPPGEPTLVWPIGTLYGLRPWYSGDCGCKTSRGCVVVFIWTLQQGLEKLPTQANHAEGSPDKSAAIKARLRQFAGIPPRGGHRRRSYIGGLDRRNDQRATKQIL